MDTKRATEDAVDWDDLLRDVEAVGGVGDVPESALIDARTAVRRAAGTERLRMERLRPRRHRHILAGLAAAAAAVAILVVPTLEIGEEPPVATATAATFLQNAAASIPASQAPSAPYLRVEYLSASVFGNVLEALQTGSPLEQMGEPTRTVWWFGRNGDRFLSLDGSAPMETFTGPPGTAHLWALGRRGSRLSWNDVLALPEDPGALGALIDQAAPGDRPGDQFRCIGGLLATAPLSGAQRGALLTVASNLDGAKLLGDATDSSGRTGVAIQVSDEWTTTKLIFDQNGMPLESTTRSMKDREFFMKSEAGVSSITVAAGTLMERTTYISAKGVSDVDQ